MYVQVLLPKHCKSAFQSTAELVVSSQGKQLIRFGGLIDDKASPKDGTVIIDVGKHHGR